MPNYLFRPDRGPVERFDAVSDAAARDYVKELLLDEGAEEGDGGGLYRTDEGGRGDEEYLGDARLGAEPDEPGYEGYVPCYWRQGHPVD